LRCQKDND